MTTEDDEQARPMALERHRFTGITGKEGHSLPETVLVVEDSEAENMRLCELVKGFGFSVLAATNGVEALALVRKNRISFIISDWQMPEMNGIELCHRVRLEARGDQPYIIFVTGRNTRADLIDGLDAGADDFMTKPVNREELRVRMQSGLRLLRLREEAEHRNQQLSEALEREGRLHEKIRDDLKRAAEMQRQILPASSEPFENIRIATLYEAAQELAGDSYNFFPVDDDHLAFFLIDVAGHGVAAAMQSFALTRLMTPETGIFHTAEPQANSAAPDGFDLPAGLVPPHRIAEALNRRFAASDACDYYFTMVCGLLNTRTGRGLLCQAGHPPPLLVSSAGEISTLGRGGYAIGMLPGVPFESTAFHLEEGDRLVLYSDGVTDCADAEGKHFNSRRLRDCLARFSGMAVQQVTERIHEELRAWNNAMHFSDDLSLLAIERTGMTTAADEERLQRLSCAVSATLESIADVIELTGRLADHAGFSERGKFELLVALTEALNNIVEHVTLAGADNRIHVQARVSGDAVVIRLRDHGRQMKTAPGTQMPEPSAEEGRGWPIIASWTDVARYRSLTGFNLLTLVKKIS